MMNDPDLNLGMLGPLPGSTNDAGDAPQEGKTKVAKAKKKAAVKPKKAISGADRSKLVSKTWKDPKVAKARKSHHGCKVAGESYRSVKAAFTALKLPLNARGKFRKLLKAAGIGGKATFEHDGKKVVFTLIEVPKVAPAKGGKPTPAKKKAAKSKTPAVAKKAAAPRKRSPKKPAADMPPAAIEPQQPEAVAAE